MLLNYHNVVTMPAAALKPSPDASNAAQMCQVCLTHSSNIAHSSHPDITRCSTAHFMQASRFSASSLSVSRAQARSNELLSSSIAEVHTCIDDNNNNNSSQSAPLVQKNEAKPCQSSVQDKNSDIPKSNKSPKNKLNQLKVDSFKPNLNLFSTSFSNSINFLRKHSLSKSDSTIKAADDQVVAAYRHNSISHYLTDKFERVGSLRNSSKSSKSTNSCGQVDLNSSSSKTNLSSASNKTNDYKSSKSPWDILCKLINCKMAFKKQYNGKKYNWIQLAGHAGRFKPGEREGYILKLMDELERDSLEALQTDVLAPFVPKIDEILHDKEDNKYYIEMQDLLYSFQNPLIMDIKIGVRTFLEEDVDKKESKPRNDLYLRLVELAPNEPTAKEHELQAITKKRYMSWRERSTCSSTLGFRIEAIKKNHVSEKEFFTVREKKEVSAHFKNYTDNKKHILKMYTKRLIELNEALKKSTFFYSHEMIGSSLLFVHDNDNAGIWMIDFGKTRPLPSGVQIRHNVPWVEGNHEDGYLIGIQSLIDIFQELISC